MSNTEQSAQLSTQEVGTQNSLARSVDTDVFAEAAAAFHGGKELFLGRRLGQTGVMSLLQTEKGNEIVGSGTTAEEALGQTLQAMRHLETVHTKANVSMPVKEGQQALFTSIEHYAPKIAPGAPTYEVPAYLESLDISNEQVLQDKSAATLKNTLETPGWDKQLLELTAAFLQSPVGAEITASLGITSLDVLTPEQAVKLSVLFVQSVSKYSYKEGVPYGEAADAKTTMDLLREGMARKGDPAWEGNGVCRNVASNVKAVFDALKQNQTGLSMLNNTYATFSKGRRDDGSYIKQRTDDSHSGITEMNIDGHAWNTFVTLDETGSANITSIDATWALEHDGQNALKHLDYTTVRMAGLVYSLAETSDSKEEAVLALADYYNKLVNETGKKYGLTSKKFHDTKEFVFTQYIKYVGNNPALLTLKKSGIVPRDIAATAYSLQDRLSQDELATLFAMSKVGLLENFHDIVSRYVNGNRVTRRPQDRTRRFIIQNSQLQELLLQTIGLEQSAVMSESDSRFRVRLRETHPEVLPAFDPVNNAADARELQELAGQATIHHESNPERIYKRIKERLLSLAGSEELYAAVTVDRTNYDLVKNYNALKSTLTKFISR